MIIDGMDVVDEIAKCNTDYNDKPLRDQIMEEVTVDTNGEEYDEPERY